MIKKEYLTFSKNKPDAVIIAAAKVGGIKVNNNENEFIYENLSVKNI